MGTCAISQLAVAWSSTASKDEMSHNPTACLNNTSQRCLPKCNDLNACAIPKKTKFQDWNSYLRAASFAVLS